MREIKFRGKCRDDGEWVYGYLTKAEAHNHAVIWEKDPEAPQYLLACDVDTDTVGQYTGFHDKNRHADIYEGDILEVRANGAGVVMWDKEGLWRVAYADGHLHDFAGHTFMIANSIVIGNIHDNPELMKEK